MKFATTIEQQIQTLQNRGMLVDISMGKAKEILSDIGYFRLGLYCAPLETSYPHKEYRTYIYKQNTRFSDVVNLYYFDVDLRNILSKYLNRVEINFRTKIVYIVSNKYIDCNTWFANPSIMRKTFTDKFDTQLYTENFKKNPIIKRHHKKYVNDKYAPAWKTLEFFTFGTILKIFQNLKDVSLKQKISLQYNIRNVDTFENYFRTIVQLRNLCAHGAILFNHTLAQPLRNGVALKIDNNNKQKLFSAIKILHYLLQQISKNRANEMKDEINQLFDKIDSIQVIGDLIKILLVKHIYSKICYLCIVIKCLCKQALHPAL